jgi:hypothetical protein
LVDETISIPSKAIEVDGAQIHEPEPLITSVEEINVINSNIEVPITNIDLVPTVSLTIKSEEVLEVNDSDKEILANSIPSSTPALDEPIQNIEVSNILEENHQSNHPKKVVEEESKPGNTFVQYYILSYQLIKK